jgi:DNA-directed RNA polymerase subunit RPC12/RpoP
MTMHQRLILDLHDIVGVEYTCAHCQAKYLIPIEKFDRVIYQCPNCKESLVRPGHADSAKVSDEGSLLNFVGTLRDLRDREIGIKLEISSSDPS